MKAVTSKQREMIKTLAEPVFGNIEGSGFLPFSEWLMENFGFFDIYTMDAMDANKVIERLKEKGVCRTKAKGKPIPPPNVPEAKKSAFWKGVVKAMAKVYLRGFYEGSVSKEPPPALEVIEEEIFNSLGDR
ncbi:hypothetical protein RZR97_08335 [Hydrogenimonas thermophila]|uniref:hypothetical protein n=1 Tax=Hydrogenimonas thermophila TaxID=223786 RepID=UPI0029372E5F|nr:hypothetical protein [Hydrogenimonas thermophila]WOE69115.1 hypothetical protein RZR91_08360 [Hydrogenimonas thermophila]WOE71625.1 hypothetical protein RZR97_08335 [Hydrogenimonas thermophila]